MRRTLLLIGSISLLLLPLGCGVMADTGGDREDREDRKLAQGYTPCNDFPNPTYGVICHPNQYCGSQRFGTCYTGCLSDDNCTDEQACYKSSGQNLGTCTSRALLEARRTGENLDPGYTSCGDPLNASRFAICHPGQYCSSDYFGSCTLGCLSELNCTERQDCVKAPTKHVGACTSSTAPANATSSDEI
ncbi:MAG: hypothetical protein H0U74_14875 [Bradymonadaceae bacterium]|nr:hypothetical protein [Lujinxingiaceae bacterium]